MEFLNIVISKNNSEQVGVVLHRIMAPNDLEVIVDQVGNLSAAKETVPLLFSAEAILASSTSKFGIEIPRVDGRISIHPLNQPTPLL